MGRARPIGAALVSWVFLVLAGPAAWAQDLPEGDAERGAYVFQLAGCLGCHTDSANGGAPLAGGRVLNSDFGSFVTPNITPDREHGIGNWTLAEFDRALRDGIGPDGTTYYPSFPYDYFTRMDDQDVADLYAYLMAQPASDNAVGDHDLSFPFDMRFLLFFWRMLYFEAGPEAADPEHDETWHRGRYIVDALGHCGACHTPRTWLGGADTDLYLAGTGSGPDGDLVPNITPNIETGIGSWSELDMMLLLRAGLLPDGDAVGSDMAEVVRNSTRALTDEDAAALITYLANIPPIDNKPVRGEP